MSDTTVTLTQDEMSVVSFAVGVYLGEYLRRATAGGTLTEQDREHASMVLALATKLQEAQDERDNRNAD